MGDGVASGDGSDGAGPAPFGVCVPDDGSSGASVDVATDGDGDSSDDDGSDDDGSLAGPLVRRKAPARTTREAATARTTAWRRCMRYVPVAPALLAEPDAERASLVTSTSTVEKNSSPNSAFPSPSYHV